MAGVSGSEVLYKRRSKLGMTTLTFRSRRYTFPSVIVKGDMKREGDMCVMLDVGLFCPFCTGAYQAKFMSSQSKLAITKTPSQDSLSGQAVPGREHCAVDNSQETTSASGYYDEKLAQVTLGPHQQTCVHQHGAKQSVEAGEHSCKSSGANAAYLPQQTALSAEHQHNHYSKSETISVAEKRDKSDKYFREKQTRETEKRQTVERSVASIGPDSPDTSDAEPVQINISIGENEASMLQTELENLSTAQEPVQIEFTESIPYMENGESNVESPPVTSSHQMCDSMDSIGRSDYGSLDTSTTSKTLDDSLQSVQEMLETLSTDYDSIERMTSPLVDSGNCFDPRDTVQGVSEGPEITETKHESLERIPRSDVTARNSELLAQAPPHKRHSDDVTMRSEYTHSLLTASAITATDVTDHATIQSGPEMTPHVQASQKVAIPELKIDLSSREDLDFCVSDDEQLDVANAMEDDLVAELLGDENIESDDEAIQKEFFDNMAPSSLPAKQIKDDSFDKDNCDKAISDGRDSNSSDNGEDSFTTARHIMGDSLLGSISNQPILQEDDRDAESKNIAVATETQKSVQLVETFSVPDVAKRESANRIQEESDEDENRSLSPESFLDSVLEEMESEIISGEATLGRIFSLKRDFHSPETPVEDDPIEKALSTMRNNSEQTTPASLNISMESENVFPTPEPPRQYPRQPSPETLLEEVLESMADLDDSYDWTSDYESDEKDANETRPSKQTKTDYQFTSTDFPQRDDNMTSSCECMAGDTIMETGSSIEPAPSTNTDTSDTSFDFSADEYISDSDDVHDAVRADSEKSFEKIIGETKLLTENLLAIFCENLKSSEIAQQNNKLPADNSQKSARTSKIVSVETSFLNGSSANVEVQADLEATVTTENESVLTSEEKEQTTETEVISVKPINEPDVDATVTNVEPEASNDLNIERISDSTTRPYKETYNILNTSKQEKLSIEESFHFDQICAPKSPVLHKSPAYAKVHKIPTIENETKPNNITEKTPQKINSQSLSHEVRYPPQPGPDSQDQHYPSDDAIVPRIVQEEAVEVIDTDLNAEIPLEIAKEQHGQILVNRSELEEYADNKRIAETRGMAYLAVYDAPLDISLSESDIEEEYEANYLDPSESLEDLLDSDVSSEFDLLDDRKPPGDEKQKSKNSVPLQVNVHNTSSNQSVESRSLNGPLSPVTDDYLPEVVEPPAKPEIVKQVCEAAQIVSKLLEQHHVKQPTNENGNSETDSKGDSHSQSDFDAAIQNGDFSHLVSEASTNVAQFETKDVLSKGQAQDFIRYVLGGKHDDDHPDASNDVHSCLQEVCQSCVDTKEVGDSDDGKSEEVTSQEVTLVFAWPKHKQRPAYKGKQPFREIHLHRVTRITDFDVEVIEGPTIETIEYTPDGIKREKSELNKDTAKLKRLTPASKTESQIENKTISKSSAPEIDQNGDDLAQIREGCTSPPPDSFKPEITPLLFHSGNDNLVLKPEAKRVPDTAVNDGTGLQTSIALSHESRHTDEQVFHENGEIRTENYLNLDLAISGMPCLDNNNEPIETTFDTHIHNTTPNANDLPTSDLRKLSLTIKDLRNLEARLALLEEKKRMLNNTTCADTGHVPLQSAIAKTEAEGEHRNITLSGDNTESSTNTLLSCDLHDNMHALSDLIARIYPTDILHVAELEHCDCSNIAHLFATVIPTSEHICRSSLEYTGLSIPYVSEAPIGEYTHPCSHACCSDAIVSPSSSELELGDNQDVFHIATGAYLRGCASVRGQHRPIGSITSQRDETVEAAEFRQKAWQPRDSREPILKETLHHQIARSSSFTYNIPPLKRPRSASDPTPVTEYVDADYESDDDLIAEITKSCIDHDIHSVGQDHRRIHEIDVTRFFLSPTESDQSSEGKGTIAYESHVLGSASKRKCASQTDMVEHNHQDVNNIDKDHSCHSESTSSEVLDPSTIRVLQTAQQQRDDTREHDSSRLDTVPNMTDMTQISETLDTHCVVYPGVIPESRHDTQPPSLPSSSRDQSLASSDTTDCDVGFRGSKSGTDEKDIFEIARTDRGMSTPDKLCGIPEIETLANKYSAAGHTDIYEPADNLPTRSIVKSTSPNSEPCQAASSPPSDSFSPDVASLLFGSRKIRKRSLNKIDRNGRCGKAIRKLSLPLDTCQATVHPVRKLSLPLETLDKPDITGSPVVDTPPMDSFAPELTALLFSKPQTSNDSTVQTETSIQFPKPAPLSRKDSDVQSHESPPISPNLTAVRGEKTDISDTPQVDQFPAEFMTLLFPRQEPSDVTPVMQKPTQSPDTFSHKVSTKTEVVDSASAEAKNTSVTDDNYVNQTRVTAGSQTVVTEVTDSDGSAGDRLCIFPSNQVPLIERDITTETPESDTLMDVRTSTSNDCISAANVSDLTFSTSEIDSGDDDVRESSKYSTTTDIPKPETEILLSMDSPDRKNLKSEDILTSTKSYSPNSKFDDYFTNIKVSETQTFETREFSTDITGSDSSITDRDDSPLDISAIHEVQPIDFSPNNNLLPEIDDFADELSRHILDSVLDVTPSIAASAIAAREHRDHYKSDTAFMTDNLDQSVEGDEAYITDSTDEPIATSNERDVIDKSDEDHSCMSTGDTLIADTETTDHVSVESDSILDETPELSQTSFVNATDLRSDAAAASHKVDFDLFPNEDLAPKIDDITNVLVRDILMSALQSIGKILSSSSQVDGKLTETNCLSDANDLCVQSSRDVDHESNVDNFQDTRDTSRQYVCPLSASKDKAFVIADPPGHDGTLVDNNLVEELIFDNDLSRKSDSVCRSADSSKPDLTHLSSSAENVMCREVCVGDQASNGSNLVFGGNEEYIILDDAVSEEISRGSESVGGRHSPTRELNQLVACEQISSEAFSVEFTDKSGSKEYSVDKPCDLNQTDVGGGIETSSAIDTEDNALASIDTVVDHAVTARPPLDSQIEIIITPDCDLLDSVDSSTCDCLDPQSSQIGIAKDIDKLEDTQVREAKDPVQSVDAQTEEVKDIDKSEDTRIGEAKDIHKSEDIQTGEAKGIYKPEDTHIGEAIDPIKLVDTQTGDVKDIEKSKDTHIGEAEDTDKSEDTQTRESKGIDKTEDAQTGDAKYNDKPEDSETGEDKNIDKPEATRTGEAKDIDKPENTLGTNEVQIIDDTLDYEAVARQETQSLDDIKDHCRPRGLCDIARQSQESDVHPDISDQMLRKELEVLEEFSPKVRPDDFMLVDLGGTVDYEADSISYETMLPFLLDDFSGSFDPTMPLAPITPGNDESQPTALDDVTSSDATHSSDMSEFLQTTADECPWPRDHSVKCGFDLQMSDQVLSPSLPHSAKNATGVTDRIDDGKSSSVAIGLETPETDDMLSEASNEYLEDPLDILEEVSIGTDSSLSSSCSDLGIEEEGNAECTKTNSDVSSQAVEVPKVKQRAKTANENRSRQSAFAGVGENTYAKESREFLRKKAQDVSNLVEEQHVIHDKLDSIKDDFDKLLDNVMEVKKKLHKSRPRHKRRSSAGRHYRPDFRGMGMQSAYPIESRRSRSFDYQASCVDTGSQGIMQYKPLRFKPKDLDQPELSQQRHQAASASSDASQPRRQSVPGIPDSNPVRADVEDENKEPRSRSVDTCRRRFSSRSWSDYRTNPWQPTRIFRASRKPDNK